MVKLSNKPIWYLMAHLVPITDEESEITIRFMVRNKDDWSLVNIECTKSTTCSVHRRRRKVRISSDLVLKLEMVSPIRVWLDWAACAQNSVLPWHPPLFYSVPTHFFEVPIVVIYWKKNWVCDFVIFFLDFVIFFVYQLYNFIFNVYYVASLMTKVY